jgi:hypothetical protein
VLEDAVRVCRGLDNTRPARQSAYIRRGHKSACRCRVRVVVPDVEVCGRKNACGSRKNDCEGRENDCGGRKNDCGGRENACGSRKNACGSRENACGGRENACGGRENACGGRESAYRVTVVTVLVEDMIVIDQSKKCA